MFWFFLETVYKCTYLLIDEVFSTYIEACPRFERDSETTSSSPSPVSLREADQVGISSHGASSPPQLPFWREVYPTSNLQSKTDEDRQFSWVFCFILPKSTRLPWPRQSQLVQWILNKLCFTVFTMGSDCIHTLSLPPWRNITLKSECPFCHPLIKMLCLVNSF